MQVSKFGGASVKDAEGVRNLGEIVKKEISEGDIIVVSAMGKTTQRLEDLVNDALDGKQVFEQLDSIKRFHQQVLKEVCNQQLSEAAPILELNRLFSQLSRQLSAYHDKDPLELKDQVLAYGEILSTLVVTQYLKEIGIKAIWKDIRPYLRTDNSFGNARVEWEMTLSGIREAFAAPGQIIVTQGYIGSTLTGKTTTLGKEGSDFTAAIIARACEAEHVTFWKDVDGIYSVDPKMNDAAVLYEQLSYRQVVEMTYYGAKVIHPKTMRPLSQGDIPLYVRSFIKPQLKGTRVINEVLKSMEVPQVIYKEDQVLVSFKIINLEFIGENNIGLIFYTLDRLNIQVNMIQSSAVSCSFVFDWSEEKMEALKKALDHQFSLFFNTGLTLGTFKNIPTKEVDRLLKDVTVFLEQSTRNKVRVLYKKTR